MNEFVEYSYIDLKKNRKTIQLSKELNNKAEQAKLDYEKSFKYIQAQEYNIWRQALKSYHLSTFDRQQMLNGQKQYWRQNISIGLVRSFVDVLISTVQEKPLTFIGTGVNKKGLENKDNILKTLNYVSDVTGFHKQLKTALADGLIFGEIALSVGYKKTRKKETIVSTVNNTHIEETVDIEEEDYPYTNTVNIFNIFPDMYTGPLRYVTERGVVPYLDFIKTFGNLIRNKKNESSMKSDDFIKLLSINNEKADFTDYGNIENRVHEEINRELGARDQYKQNNNTNNVIAGQFTSTAATQDSDKQITDGLIEFLITYYDNRIVLRANGYPVYIGPNFYGFIPYVIKAANQSKTRFGEGIPYLLKGLEEVANSHVNNYFDSARSMANPTLVVNKNLLINDDQIENGTPGAVIYTENTDGGKVIYRLDKGGLNDFGVMPLIEQIARQITGISEYTLGQSAGERTATGALSVAQSSNRRMSPYMSNFVDAVSVVAKMWLKLLKKYWDTDKWIYVLDDQGTQTEDTVKNSDLAGAVDISLQAEGLFGSYNELEFNKLLNMFQVLGPSGFLNSIELGNELVKKAGYAPSKFITEPGQGIKPDNADQLNAISSQINQPGANPAQNLGNILGQTNNPQTDLGHGGQGQ